MININKRGRNVDHANFPDPNGKCHECQKTIKIRNKFCSNDCRAKWSIKQNRIIYNSNPIKCKGCKGKLSFEQAAQKGKFCGHSCAAKFNNLGIKRNKKTKDNRNWAEILKIYNDNNISYRELQRTYRFGHSAFSRACKEHKFKKERISTKIERILNGSGEPHNRDHLKKSIIKHGYIKNECNECGQKPEWYGRKLVLILDHINGIFNDNKIENLRLLCPNCNSQTETFAGRRKRYKCEEISNKMDMRDAA